MKQLSHRHTVASASGAESLTARIAKEEQSKSAESSSQTEDDNSLLPDHEYGHASAPERTESGCEGGSEGSQLLQEKKLELYCFVAPAVTVFRFGLFSNHCR